MNASVMFALFGFAMVAGFALAFSIWRRLKRMQRDARYLQDHVWNSVALLQACKFESPPPTPEEWAASSDLLCEVYRLVRQNAPKLVVELGCGLSTLVIARALAANGNGKLVAIEDQETHALATRRHLAANGLDTLVDVRVVPIRAVDGAAGWYETDRLDDLEAVDFLFIDGPGLSGEEVRGPSLPFFWDRLGRGAIAILDDAARPGERAIARAWRESFPAGEFHYVPFRKGALIIQKPN